MYNTGNAIGLCVGNDRWPDLNISQCGTVRCLQDLAENISDVLQNQLQNCSNENNDGLMFHCSLEMLISITAEIRDSINTSVPILQSDIPIIVATLESVFKYVDTYVCISLILINIM